MLGVWEGDRVARAKMANAVANQGLESIVMHGLRRAGMSVGRFEG
jgi:hypothetical protein